MFFIKTTLRDFRASIDIMNQNLNFECYEPKEANKVGVYNKERLTKMEAHNNR